MTSMRPAEPPFAAIATLLAAVVLAASPLRGQTTSLDAMRRAAESAPAMQGHDAEARARDPEAEIRQRRLFFDPAGREEGKAQVSCDHRVLRRPDLDGGAAAVAVLWTPADGRILARHWEVTDAAAIDLEAMKRRLAEAAPPGAVVDGLAFRRCR